MAVAERDDVHMREALRLAGKGRGRTSPNPMVGAIVVDGRGVVVGAGYHERAGGDHAEVRALAQAGEAARGAALYCTLEPCCHQGRTGPCVERLVEAAVARVVVAMPDPNPAVNGKGIESLRRQGIAVDVGLRASEAEATERGVRHLGVQAATVRDDEGRRQSRRLHCRAAGRANDVDVARDQPGRAHAAVGGGRHRGGLDDGPGRRPAVDCPRDAAGAASDACHLRSPAAHAADGAPLPYAGGGAGGRADDGVRIRAAPRPGGPARGRRGGYRAPGCRPIPARCLRAARGARADELRSRRRAAHA